MSDQFSKKRQVQELFAGLAPQHGLDELIQRTTAHLRNQGIDIEEDNLARALRDSPMAQAVQCLQTDLEQARIEALTDSLTGLPNRAGFMRALHDRLESLATGAATGDIAVVLLDLDGFKDLNDHCGHDYGDHALRRVDRRLNAAFADVNGIVGRLGGDEIALLMPASAALDEQHEIRASIDEAFNGLVYWNKQQPYPLSASIGLEIYDDNAVRTAQTPIREQISKVLKQADSKMYDDKWGAYDSKSDRDNPDVPKNQRLQELRVKYAAQRNAPLVSPSLTSRPL